MKSIHLTVGLLWLLFFPGGAQDNLDCFSILVGKNASADESVLFAHNEDDWGDRVVNWYKVPEARYKAGETITLKNGAVMERPSNGWSYIWLEMPEMEFSDSYMNEWGVTIASDACPSREEHPELSEGGIGYWLRRIMAEQARTARQAVKIGGALVEKYGYISSGRTYCIADSRESWMMAVVNGKHWVAQRIPNDHVAIIPNYYTITSINLGDTMNYYGSADIVTYAIQNKWYNPRTDGTFNFSQVYGHPESLANMSNIVRHLSAINKLSEKQYIAGDDLPFSFKPKDKVDLAMLFAILRDHNENTLYDDWQGDTLTNPHQHERAICSNTTQYGFVAQLRTNLPREFAFVLWLSPFRPCVHAFTPWYIGMTEMPDGFAGDLYGTAVEHHFETISSVWEYFPSHKFLKFVKHARLVDDQYARQIPDIKKAITAFEAELLGKQKTYENSLKSLSAKDKELVKKSITDYCSKQVNESLKMIR